jgi:hypothetical protein
VPYGQPGAGGFESFRALGGLAKSLQILMVVVLAGNVITLFATVALRKRIVDFVGGEGNLDDADSALATLGGITSLTGLAQIAVVVLTMIWMFRLAKNHQLLGRMGSTWAPGWAIGGWFCPPCVFVIPWLMFQELWKGSTPGMAPNDPNWKRAPWGALPTIWWVLYGLGSIAVGAASLTVSFGNASTFDAAEAFRDRFGFNILGTLVTIAAGVVYIMLIRELTSRQQALTGAG